MAKTKTVALSALIPNKDNPRKISPGAFEVLKNSIKRDPDFMRLRPIVVDEGGVIIGGNQRYKALMELNRKTIPEAWVLRAKGLTEEQRKRFIVVDNSPEGMAGYWDYPILELNYDMPTLIDFGFKFPEDIDPNKVWEGMPEFDQKKRAFYKQIIVRFLKKKDYDRFAKLIGQTLSEKTKCIWYPPHDFDSMGREVEIV